MPATLDFTKPHVLRTEEEYQAAVSEVDTLLDADVRAGTEGYDRLEFLSVLIQVYEDKHHPIDDSLVTAQDAVLFMSEQKGMSRAELAEILGGRSRVSEFFGGKRPLSRTQIQKLRDALGIPADLLL